MMEQFWRKKSFKVLAKEWNKKLAQSEFIDAEVELKDDRALKQRAANSYRQASQLERESRLEYYSLLGHLVSKESFTDKLEELVMTRHSEGFTNKEIVDEVKRIRPKIHRNTVWYIIRRWEMRWGIKFWTLKQMGLKKNQVTG